MEEFALPDPEGLEAPQNGALHTSPSDLETESTEENRGKNGEVNPSDWERLQILGQVNPLSDSEPEEDEGQPTRVFLHQLFGRKVTLHPGNIVCKAGQSVPLAEAAALKVAAEAGIPAPRLVSAYTTTTDEPSSSKVHIHMTLVPVPAVMRQAFALRLRTDHRVVLSHCDLAPRNIMVQDGTITGLIDWEFCGWYPEYWEYVKFFQRSGPDWLAYVEDIFPELYHQDFVDYFALAHWSYE
ncbi:hypothetical protein F5Y17DRAFT_458920 [Xylariaceae sp. FL0594]|nr:hypothetical protein F5Y17DRAFT_458920 [Xylariaceae sp. FL0594]